MNKYLILLFFIPFLSTAQEKTTKIETASWAEGLDRPTVKFLENTKNKYVNDTLWIGYDDTILPSKKLAFFYRLQPVKKKDLYNIKDFYKDGTLQMEGTFTDYDGQLKEGKILIYRSNGTLEWEAIYENNRLKDFDQSADEVAVLTKKEKLINFKLPFKKKKEEDDESYESDFRSLYNSSSFGSELDIDEKYFTTTLQDKVLITKNNKTEEVISRLEIEDNVPINGSLTVYNGNREFLHVKKDPEDGLYKLLILYDDGSVFINFDLVDESIQYYSPSGELLASGNEKSGSYLYGLNESRLFGFSYITPLKEDQPFIVMHQTNDGDKYIEKYYNYKQPEIKFEPTTKTISNYSTNGELIGKYTLEDGKGPIMFSRLENIEQGFLKEFYPSGNLKSISRYEPSRKTTEIYNDSKKNKIIKIEYLKKDDGNWTFIEPYKEERFNSKGLKVFEEEIVDDKKYVSVNYDDKGQEIGSFTYEGSRIRDLNNFPEDYNDPKGHISKTMDIERFTFFNDADYSDIPVTMSYELIYNDGTKTKELIELNDMLFIDYNFNGNSTFYHPIANKTVSCSIKDGVPMDGTIVDYYISQYKISFSSIITYKDGREIKRTNYDDKSAGTYITNDIEIKDEEQFLTTYLNGRKYILNKTSLNGDYTAPTGGRDNLVSDYMNSSDLFGHVMATFKDSYLEQLTKYKNFAGAIVDRDEDDFDNDTFIRDTQWMYRNGEVSKVQSYYTPESRLSQLHAAGALEFKDGAPYNGEVLLKGYSKPTYYRVKDGEVILKVIDDGNTFYVVDQDKIVKTTLLSPNSTLGSYNQKIIYDRATGATSYVAVYDKKKTAVASFEGIKMQSGIVHYTSLFSGTTTLIVKNEKVYKFDKFIGKGNFSENKAIAEIPVSSTEAQFIEFYDFGYRNPLLIDPDEHGNLSIDRL